MKSPEIGTILMSDVSAIKANICIIKSVQYLQRKRRSILYN